jgi:membrane-bound ClpP family serine protease
MRFPARSKLILGVVGVAILIAGGVLLLSSRTTEGFQSVPELVEALETGGIACTDLQTSDIELAEDLGGQFGSCTINDETVNIHVYFVDPDRVAGHIKNNVSVRGQSPTYFTSLVAGSNWVVDSYAVATSKEVQAVLGGEIH